jgi:predicted ATPase
MITKWKVFNFKSVRKETELSFGPLTIFAGANSSGKSTILQSILLISQTLGHKLGSRSVVLNGTFARLGQFDDLRSSGGEAAQIMIGWECQQNPKIAPAALEEPRRLGRFLPYGIRSQMIKRVNCEITFDSDPSSPQRDLYQLQPRLFSCALSMVSRDQDNVDFQSSISITRAALQVPNTIDKLHRLRIADTENELARASLDFDVILDEGSLEDIREDIPSAEAVGCSLRHFLPERVSLRINRTVEDANFVASIICDDNPRGPRSRIYLERDITIPSGVISSLEEILGERLQTVFQPSAVEAHLAEHGSVTNYTLRNWVDGLRKLSPARRFEIRKLLRSKPELHDLISNFVRSGQSDSFELIPIRPPIGIQDAVQYLDSFFSSSVKYLGPLRDEPKPLYPLAASPDPTDVGLRGELTAAVYDLHKNGRIQYIPTSYFKTPAVQEGVSVRTLEAAVTDWLQYLGVAENIQSRDRGKLGHELKVTLTPNVEPYDLTHVGVGVSQVLPILVSCLLASTDVTLIFEQPEIHLHPRVQTLLGDFFLSMALMGKQCIIETHSEYLINRLRFRAAAAPAERDITSNIKMYFVERQQNVSTFRDVVVNEYGAIPDWPEGFFDQSQFEAEEILRAASRKRKGKQQRKENA